MVLFQNIFIWDEFTNTKNTAVVGFYFACSTHDIYFSGDIIWMHLCAIVIMPQAGGMLEYLRHERIYVWKWILVRGTLLLVRGIPL